LNLSQIKFKLAVLMMIIVIDGPAGSGKSSTAKAIANKLDIQYLDSGAIYRAITLIWLEQDKPSDEKFFESLSEYEIQFDFTDSTFFVNINGHNVTDRIRSEEVSNNVSEIAAKKNIRGYVNSLMRETVKKDGIFIADGRDLGTAVFPDAALKFYMDASVEERARRRFNELNHTNGNISEADIKKNIMQRDKKDSTRSADPLKKADDAVYIDTSELTFDEQVNKISSVIKKRILN